MMMNSYPWKKGLLAFGVITENEVQGMKLRRGDVIGQVGMTGRANGSHLHYEIQKDQRRVNPMKYIRPENDC